VASTHYTELKTYAYATPGVANASVEFDVHTLRPTYELTIGLPGRSNALAIAERLGLPGAIVSRAREGLAVSEVEMEDLLAEIREARRAATEQRVATTEQRVRAERWAGKLETALREVEEQRAELLNTARRQAEAELETARRAIRRLLDRAERTGGSREMLEEARSGLSAKVEELGEIVAEREEAETIVPPPEPELLLPGARVRVRSLGAEGEVLETAERSDEVIVQLGSLRMRVELNDLEWVAAPPDAPAVASGGQLSFDTGSASPVELDLRGMRVEEALNKLDEQLDRALLVGSPFMRLIHGHGTGALKKSIREALRQHPSVVRHRAGERGEGGDGATVVYFD
jgi:DNA mismatch repair protein MutS2